MKWEPDGAIEDFRIVAELAGVRLCPHDIEIEKLPAPHKPPSRLPPGKMAVYVFHSGTTCLKVGKAGPKSQARYTSQHYNPKSAMSTLAASMLADGVAFGDATFDETDVGQWIKDHIDRVNFLLDAQQGMPVVTLLEAFLQCRLMPKYEGFKSQRK